MVAKLEVFCAVSSNILGVTNPNELYYKRQIYAKMSNHVLYVYPKVWTDQLFAFMYVK